MLWDPKSHQNFMSITRQKMSCQISKLHEILEIQHIFDPKYLEIRVPENPGIPGQTLKPHPLAYLIFLISDQFFSGMEKVQFSILKMNMFLISRCY